MRKRPERETQNLEKEPEAEGSESYRPAVPVGPFSHNFRFTVDPRVAWS